MSGWGAIYNRTQQALRMHSAELARLQEQAATGSRLIRVSDGPADASRVLHLQTQVRKYTAYVANLDNLTPSLTQASSVMEQLSEVLQEAQALATQAASGTYSQANRNSIAANIDSLLEQAVFLANTRHMGRYLFSGAAATEPAYAATREGGRITQVRYAGSLDELPAPVAPGLEYAGTLVGPDAFRASQRAAPTFLGGTGAAAGSGTSSAVGDVWLTVAHLATSLQPGSGIAPGASTADDTIVGTHTLSINAAARTLTLDSGPAVSFTGAEADLAVANSAGDVVHLDMTGWADFDGNLEITATGTLSIDDGASTVALDTASANLAVADSRSGRVLFVDARSIARAGLEPVRVGGTHDLFEALLAVRDALTNARGGDDQEQLIQQSITSLNEAHAVLMQSVAATGGRLQSMDMLKQSLTAVKDQNADQADQIQQADVAQLAVDLARTQTLYQMTLATSSRLLSLSLLDYL